jgi:hypothetical protein
VLKPAGQIHLWQGAGSKKQVERAFGSIAAFHLNRYKISRIKLGNTRWNNCAGMIAAKL